MGVCRRWQSVKGAIDDHDRATLGRLSCAATPVHPHPVRDEQQTDDLLQEVFLKIHTISTPCAHRRRWGAGSIKSPAM